MADTTPNSFGAEIGLASLAKGFVTIVVSTLALIML